MTGRVLVVDDLEQNVRLLEAKLTSEYYTVFSTYSGIECLEKVKSISPDIILLDVMMPEMDGFETCTRLKADIDTAHIPVVMVTALSEVKDRVHGLKAGANDFITKPINEIHLFARVKSLIRIKVMLDELRMRDKTGAELGIVENNFLTSEEDLTGNIMVIDDDIIQSRNIHQILTKQQHRVTLSDHGNILDSIATGAFDLIIISTMLDDVDGLRLGMDIRSKDKSRQIPIMILVDEGDKTLLAKALDIGIDDYITTPMDTQELIARVFTQIKRKKYQDALKSDLMESVSASIVDSLTKLYNRRYLDTHLNNIVAQTLEKNGELSIMIIDIDHFKAVNDQPGWGHHIGDEILISVAKRIMGSIRSTDLATRQGGEEFVVIMPNTPTDKAKKIAERTRKNMENIPFEISAAPGQATCTISIGVSSIVAGDTVAELLKRADHALFEAKEHGRNRVVVSGEPSEW